MRDAAHKREYDRAYRAANRNREGPRRRAFDRTPKRYTRRLATDRYRYRTRAIARMKEALNGAPQRRV